MAYPIQDLLLLTISKTSEVWKTIVSAIATITSEAQFEADKTGIAFRSKDQAKQAFLEIFIPSNTFQHYYCPGLLRFGILADDLLKVVKRFDLDVPVELFIRGKFLVVTSQGTSVRHYEFGLIESKPLASSLNRMTFHTKLVLRSEMLAAILDDIKVLSTKLTLKTIHRQTTTTTFDGMGEAGAALITIGQIHEDTNILLHDSALERCEGKYSIQPISQLLNLLGALCEFVELEYTDRGPLSLKFLLFDLIHLQLYVAHQLES